MALNPTAQNAIGGTISGVVVLLIDKLIQHPPESLGKIAPTAPGLSDFFTIAVVGVAVFWALTLRAERDRLRKEVAERSRVFDPDAVMEEVRGRTFRNERVPLDGYRYVNCVFENVTLEYRGETRIELIGDHFKGYVLELRESLPLSDLYNFLVMSGQLRGDARMLDPDTHAPISVADWRRRFGNTDVDPMPQSAPSTSEGQR